ncbi:MULTISPECIES: hypothetical protein [Bacillales]|uniref:hypothetical protein n=1 Tax=Bacillales TaxID=1385 RepID=UPI000349CB08|nr:MULTISPECIES: hypothetical protein [Bacillales]KMZ43995.1 hypothetical protein AC624_24515 [Bacillus sp. FJAT-27238]
MNLTEVLAAHGLSGKKIALPKDLVEVDTIVWETSNTVSYDLINLDNSDDIYLAKKYDTEVKKIRSHGVVAWTVALDFGVSAVCIGQDGYYYAVGAKKAAKINMTTGAVTTITFSGFNLVSVYHAAVDISGNIYLSCQDDTYTNVRAYKIVPAGTRAWLYDSGVTTANGSSGICVISSHLYVNLGGNMYKFLLTGGLVWSGNGFDLYGVIPDPSDSSRAYALNGRKFTRYSLSGASGPTILNETSVNLGTIDFASVYLRVIGEFGYVTTTEYWFKIRLSDLKVVGIRGDNKIRAIASDSSFIILLAGVVRRMKYQYKIK